MFKSNADSHPPLMTAVCAGHLEVCKTLLSKMEILKTSGVLDYSDSRGRTVFHLAAQLDKEDVLKVSFHGTKFQPLKRVNIQHCIIMACMQLIVLDLKRISSIIEGWLMTYFGSYKSLFI